MVTNNAIQKTSVGRNHKSFDRLDLEAEEKEKIEVDSELRSLNHWDETWEA